MVFAPGTPLGKAKVRRCKRTCLGIDEIVSEAEALWLAESPDGSPRKRSERLGAGWGCVTLLPNPHSVVPLTLLDAWAERVAGKLAYDHRRFSVLGASAIDDRGILQMIGLMPWILASQLRAWTFCSQQPHDQLPIPQLATSRQRPRWQEYGTKRGVRVTFVTTGKAASIHFKTKKSRCCCAFEC